MYAAWTYASTFSGSITHSRRESVRPLTSLLSTWTQASFFLFFFVFFFRLSAFHLGKFSSTQSFVCFDSFIRNLVAFSTEPVGGGSLWFRFRFRHKLKIKSRSRVFVLSSGTCAVSVRNEFTYYQMALNHDQYLSFCALLIFILFQACS